MNTENVQILTDRISEQGSSPHTSALRYLNAAHVKLTKLQAWRQQQKLVYAACVLERDAALCELEKLKLDLDEKSRKLKKARGLIDMQSQLIEELQDPGSGLRKKLKRSQRAGPVDSDKPALTVRALEKVATHIDQTANTAKTDNQGLLAGAAGKEPLGNKRPVGLYAGMKAITEKTKALAGRFSIF